MRTTILAVLALAASQTQAQVCTWTDSTGKHTTRAELLSLASNTAELRKESGDIVAVPVDRLSEQDQLFARLLVASEKARIWAHECNRQRDERIKTYRSCIDALEKQRCQIRRAHPGSLAAAVAPDKILQSQKEIREWSAAESKRINRLESHLRDIRNGGLYMPTLITPQKIGDAGILRDGVLVFQVVNEQTMLISTVGRRYADPVMLRGRSTAGCEDGQGAAIPELLVVCDTAQYDTAAGSTNTVLVLEPVFPPGIDQEVRELLPMPYGYPACRPPGVPYPPR